MGNQKQKWTSEEEEALLAGIAKHGPGKWKNILKDPEFAPCLASRSNIDLKVFPFLLLSYWISIQVHIFPLKMLFTVVYCFLIAIILLLVRIFLSLHCFNSDAMYIEKP